LENTWTFLVAPSWHIVINETDIFVDWSDFQYHFLGVSI
jgi:hypothetical protein